MNIGRPDLFFLFCSSSPGLVGWQWDGVVTRSFFVLFASWQKDDSGMTASVWILAYLGQVPGKVPNQVASRAG